MYTPKPYLQVFQKTAIVEYNRCFLCNKFLDEGDTVWKIGKFGQACKTHSRQEVDNKINVEGTK